eukprot:6374430-Prymnesium_polylepis.1
MRRCARCVSRARRHAKEERRQLVLSCEGRLAELRTQIQAGTEQQLRELMQLLALRETQARAMAHGARTGAHRAVAHPTRTSWCNLPRVCGGDTPLQRIGAVAARARAGEAPGERAAGGVARFLRACLRL